MPVYEAGKTSRHVSTDKSGPHKFYHLRNSFCYPCSILWHPHVARTPRLSPAIFCRRSRVHLVFRATKTLCRHTGCKHTQSAPLRIRRSSSEAHPFVCYQIPIPCPPSCILDTANKSQPYFYQKEFYQEKDLIVKEVIPNLESRVKDLKKIQGDKIENNTCLEKEIIKKRALIKSLKYYYSI